MAQVVGSDADQLDALANRLAAAATQLDGHRTTLTSALVSSPWHGRDAEQFHGEWQSQLVPLLASAGQTLTGASTALRRNAAQQRTTSAAGTATGTAAPFGPPTTPSSPLEDRIRREEQELAQARAEGRDPASYRALLEQYYLDLASRRSGIDLAAWDPAAGVDGNRQTIEDVYSYYGQLFLQHPELQWAGMANMIGPSFAGGFLDLDQFADLASDVAGPVGSLPGWAKAGLPPAVVAMAELGQLSSEDIRYYETTLLSMQKNIFVDQATMHEAYLAGGADAVHELHAADKSYDARSVQAWDDIASGDPARVSHGNELLLWREQNQVIPDLYDQMRNHPVTGEAFTYALGAIGAPSIPGAHTAAEFSPLSLHHDEPVLLGAGHVGVTVDTPLPDFNISDREARWDMIEHDTLPTYQELLRDHPDEVRQIVGSDIHDRVEAARLLPQSPEIARRFATDWDVHGDAGWGPGRPW